MPLSVKTCPSLIALSLLLVVVAGSPRMVLAAENAAQRSWAGIYGGGDLGYGAGRDDVREIGGSRSYYPDLDGLSGDMHLGWQSQRGAWLWGGEVEAGYLGQSGSLSRSDSGGIVTSEAELGLYGALSGRLGYVASSWLLYIRAGFAVAGLDASTTQNCPSGPCGLAASRAETSEQTWGYLFGAGVERKLGGDDGRWSWRAEYQYITFRDELALPAGTGPGWTHDLDLHMLKLGVNYSF